MRGFRALSVVESTDETQRLIGGVLFFSQPLLEKKHMQYMHFKSNMGGKHMH